MANIISPDSVTAVVCPICKGELNLSPTEGAFCPDCQVRFPETLGIPDLRDPSADAVDSQEAALIGRLLAAYPTSGYSDLLDVHFSARSHLDIPEEIMAARKKHRETQIVRGSRLTEMFLSRWEEAYGRVERGVALDIGCGAGAGLVQLARTHAEVVGVDPDLPNLILAKKFCEEHGLSNVTLVQAYGQAMPFQQDVFDYVTAQNVLEHVLDVNGLMQDVHRVLRDHGGFAGDSRNRYDLLFPEPHVGIRWVGCLPRSFARPYVRWRTGISNYGDHIRLLSYRELRTALLQAFGGSWAIVFPKVRAYGMPDRLDALLAKIEPVPWLRRLALTVFPSHLVLAQKQVL